MEKSTHFISLNAFWNDFGNKAKRQFYKMTQNSSKNVHFDFGVELEDEDSDFYQIY